MVRNAIIALLPVFIADATVTLSATRRERPVMKVVRLLQDMKAELQKSLDDDKAVHEMLTCWCGSNDKEKTQAIDLGEQKVTQLQSTMDEATAKILDLKTKRKSTQEEQYADEKALKDARALRMKENQAFHSEEMDLQEAIAAAKGAIVALSAQHPELAQLRSAAKLLQSSRTQGRLAAGHSLRAEQLKVLREFLKQVGSAPSFLAIPGFQSYRPQSGQIFGILKQMQADFEKSLASAQSTEAKDVEEFEALQAAKEEEIASGKKAIVQMDAQLADTSEKHAQAAQEFEDTEAQLALDKEFLGKLKAKCAESGSEFDARVKSRMEEIVAVQDTIKILNSDTSFDAFEKNVNAALIQTSATSALDKKRRQRAASVLRRSGNAQLAALAASAQLDSFVKVKEAIDKMIKELAEQQEEEVKHRDWCYEELHQNERETAANDDKKTSLEVKISDLDKTIETLTADIKSTKDAIAEMQKQMKRASEVREAENADYQQTITDHRLTQAILDKALTRMKQVYAMIQDPAPVGAAHVALAGNHTDPGNGPARFTKYEQNVGGSKVVQMIEEVIADSKKTEDESIDAAQDSQTAYEDFMKDSNKGITAASKKVADMSEALATSKSALSMAKTDLKQTLQELYGLSQVNADLHKSCDYLLKNFEARQSARTAESDALAEAKAILSGLK
mmetsp:Transcript_19988/g.45543  ORF Transcript_19988/g.45543 Transcript_19988/m.45543 type:complete len:678 (+) Transcript_19988:59-2092(+)|eukprot:CAMPEP_0197891796 /NCGR_PEP_ID=MMETSP1439-20131203/29738_1 /TAXON_ID=66791 /ORGANISM="Gonyaulax spinifera, Strain CCMP409" /LENGTH=677 /DNA_ID=CAMNT_0043511929 /DNA_START=54 /DNA_END=2087 /DNA_ORIENTATION=-